ncbi:predicted protein [Streptomyces viridochromogenes DSM 40736]|uniref:Predicted protein n=1 Tax=Streptomyces viridochromogenes (strain DSM 40736 / JCM 4977 / BCRC 1201 / Tue 494) TaxID=591159 RepID=D9WY52_STRVT|nr:predicted protein [Streptomyces viridochromogenes DSM 40736]
MARGLSALRARLLPTRRCARLHCVPPAGIDRHCCARVPRSAYRLLLRILRPAYQAVPRGLLPALRRRHSACPDLHKKLAQCFTLAEPGHNSSAASHIVRTPSGRKHCRPASARTAKVSNLASGCPATPVSVRPGRWHEDERASEGRPHT